MCVKCFVTSAARTNHERAVHKSYVLSTSGGAALRAQKAGAALAADGTAVTRIVRDSESSGSTGKSSSSSDSEGQDGAADEDAEFGESEPASELRVQVQGRDAFVCGLGSSLESSAKRRRSA